MKSWLGTLALGLLLAVPAVGYAASPSVSPIGDMTLNAGTTLTVNVVAVDVDGDPITLTLALPGFAVLNARCRRWGHRDVHRDGGGGGRSGSGRDRSRHADRDGRD